MLNKRNNYKRFRSYCDINNYNKFLIELDKKQMAQDIIKNTEINLMKQSIDSTENVRDTTVDKMSFLDRLEKRLENELNKTITNNKNVSIKLNKINIKLDKTKDETDISESSKASKELNQTQELKPKQQINIDAEINNIDDLLKLINTYPEDNDIEYNINMSALHKIKIPLTELNNMIGMSVLKTNIVDQIIFYIQNFHILSNNKKQNDFMHTVIYGPPGTGKTEVAKIIGSIFSKMGILSKGTFKKVSRSDLIAGYLGQTALKTRDVINECLGGVLFIDEAYALGNEDKKDNFSKECIDTLCDSLSEHKDNLMVIIAGYEAELNACFFAYNRGLQSRFTWRFHTDEYSAEELYKIFLKKVDDYGWFIANDSGIDIKWFEKQKSHFKYYGRDIETLFAKTKISHSKRVFCLDASVKKYIILKDLNNGLDVYLKNEDSREKERENLKRLVSSMYI